MPDHIEQDMWEISSSSSNIGSKKGCSNIKNIYKLNTYTSKTYVIKEFQTCQMLIIKGMAIGQIANKKLCEELPISWHVCALQKSKDTKLFIGWPSQVIALQWIVCPISWRPKDGETFGGDDGWGWLTLVVVIRYEYQHVSAKN